MRRAARARAQAGTRRGGRRGCCQLPRCGALSRAGLKGVDGKPKGLYLQNKINKAPPKLPVLCKGFCQLSPAQETHFTGWGGELKRRMHKLAEQEPQGKTHHRHKGTHMPCKKGPGASRTHFCCTCELPGHAPWSFVWNREGVDLWREPLEGRKSLTESGGPTPPCRTSAEPETGVQAIQFLSRIVPSLPGPGRTTQLPN